MIRWLERFVRFAKANQVRRDHTVSGIRERLQTAAVAEARRREAERQVELARRREADEERKAEAEEASEAAQSEREKLARAARLRRQRALNASDRSFILRAGPEGSPSSGPSVEEQVERGAQRGFERALQGSRLRVALEAPAGSSVSGAESIGPTGVEADQTNPL